MILITGANGFVGQACLRALYPACGPNSLAALVHRHQDGLAAFEALRTVQGGLEALPDLHEALANVETIVHLATKHRDEDGSGFSVTNVAGTQAVIDFARAVGARRIIYLSSTGVYGHRSCIDGDEHLPVRPDTAYGHSKARAEALLMRAHGPDLQTMILRHRFVIGEGDRFVIPRFIRAAQRLPILPGGGRALLSFIGVDDLAEVVHRLCALEEWPDEGPLVFHVTNGEAISMLQLLDLLGERFHIEQKRVRLPFWPLYALLRAREMLQGLDPESARAGALSSLRLKMIGRHNHFSNARLMRLLPDLKMATVAEILAASHSYYRTFL